MNSPIHILLVSLLLAMPLSGAVRFTVIAWDQVVLKRLEERGLSYVSGGRLRVVDDIHTLKRSPRHRWSGEGICLFSLNGEDPGTLEEPKVVEGERVAVSFPGGEAEVLVMLVPDPREASGLAAKVYDDSSSKFPWGAYRVHNGTGSPLLMKVGPAGPRLLLAKPTLFSPRGERRNIPVAVVAEADPQRLLFSSVWKHRPDQRRLVFISRAGDARKGVLELKVIPERLSEYQRAAERATEDAGG